MDSTIPESDNRAAAAIAHSILLRGVKSRAQAEALVEGRLRDISVRARTYLAFPVSELADIAAGRPVSHIDALASPRKPPGQDGPRATALIAREERRS